MECESYKLKQIQANFIDIKFIGKIKTQRTTCGICGFQGVARAGLEPAAS